MYDRKHFESDAWWDAWDVDMDDIRRHTYQALRSFDTLDFEEPDIKKLATRWSIRQLLLEADADPTSGNSGDTYSEDCIQAGTIVRTP